MINRTLVGVVALFVALAPSCTTGPSRTINVIEFRVNGNPTLAKVRYSDPLDGLTLAVTTLPYSISIKAAARPSMFLSLDATPIGYPTPVPPVPFLSVQIFVNGTLFREANSSDLSLSTITAAGTWRSK